VDNNKLKFLPIPIGSLFLEILDISSNDFEEANARAQKVGNGSFPTLLELAAEALKTYNTRMYDSTPFLPDSHCFLEFGN